MMATEANQENLADPSTVAYDAEPITITSAQDEPIEPQVSEDSSGNGLKPDAEPVEASISSADVSVAGGSDNEATKAETTKGQPDEKGHNRTASLIKPKSFKSVSVNKTFLAAKGASGAAPVKPGEKGANSIAPSASTSASSVSRPRLVAKLGSGLGSSSPRNSISANGGKPGAAPDASAVWNKNRPAAPLEQKRFTDEELKQQYGIHLATRLQSDDPGKQANWADIDDDDEDWAPETIEWTDGTKATLPSAEDIAQAKAAPKSIASSAPSPKPSSPAPSTSAVKLGGISSGKGLVLKASTEKPTLVAKPPGPPPAVKSPWATLPPVDKVAPIAMDLPNPQLQQSSQNRFAQRDPHGFESMPSIPAKEIAADDFSRSWRDGNTNVNPNRELFNSQSGRYEPVNDNRRGSNKNDSNSRQPALLQRPSQADQPEPSAAFQTHRASGEASFGRRRASSNLSGGSGNLVRRMSRGQDMPPPHDLLNNRRGSLAATGEEGTSPRNFSPSDHLHGQRAPSQQWHSRGSPVVSHASPASNHGQVFSPSAPRPSVPNVPQEDEVELQKKIMRESRELARKRRLEAEAKEEAEKKERIRLKLEAMGPAPEPKKKEKTPQEEKAVAIQIQTRDTPLTPLPPPKPPVPDAAGEVMQYGMMRVHPPEAVTSANIDATAVPSDSNRAVKQDNRVNGIHDSPSENLETATASKPIPTESKQPSWTASSSNPDRFPTSAWANPPPHPGQGRNVWGPPTNDKTLGNGTFNPELSLHGSQSSAMAASANPGLIGPPSQIRANGYPPRGNREQYNQQRPAPIGPPSRQANSSRQPVDPARAQTAAAWNALPSKLAQEEAEQSREQGVRRELQQASGEPPAVLVFKDTWRQVGLADDGSRTGIQASVSQSINDGKSSASDIAWNKPVSDDTTTRTTSDPRQTEPSVLRNEGPQNWNGLRNELVPPMNTGTVTGATTIATRGSRFFPKTTTDVRVGEQVSHTRPGSPSPPPPTMDGHPAYDGDVFHPNVHLPAPRPVVKFPPTVAESAPKVLAPIGPPKPVASFAAAAASAPSNVLSSNNSKYQDVRYTNEAYSKQVAPAETQNWQDRINNLVGRKIPSPKHAALAVNSLSKSALELPSGEVSATVSLPGSTTGDITEDRSAVESKPMSEELFGEQEMGSLPKVRVPKKAPELAWTPFPAPTSKLSKKFTLADVTSAETLPFFQHNSSVTVKILGMKIEKVVNMAQKFDSRQRSNGRRGQSRGGSSRHTSSTHPRGGRPREVSTNAPSTSSDPAPTSPNPSGSSSSRGGGRGRGGYGYWTNHTPTKNIRNAINA